MEFWKTSASSLREKAIPQSSEKQASQKNRKIQQNKKDSFQAIRQLENAYKNMFLVPMIKDVLLKSAEKASIKKIHLIKAEKR